MNDFSQPAPWQTQQLPLTPRSQIGPQADEQKKREILAGILMNGTAGKQPDVMQMYNWMRYA